MRTGQPNKSVAAFRLTVCGPVLISKNLSTLTIEGVVMKDQKAGKCAHIPCRCEVADGEQYCGNACREAGGEDVEIACQCDHPQCPLVS